VSLATPTFSQIKAQVAAIRQKIPNARVIGIRAPGRWSGNAPPTEGDETYLIRQCDSPLAMRLALREEAGEQVTKVLVTNLEEKDLSADILVRLTRRRLYQIDNWQIVSSLFQAQTVDSRLTRHSWIADALLELVPSEGYPSARGGFLDAEVVWPFLLRRAIGLASEMPDLTAILKWSVEAENVRRFQRLAKNLQQGSIEWLSERAGAAAQAILECVAKMERADAVPLGLAAGVVFHTAAAGKLERAAVRMEERYFGGRTPGLSVIERWSAAATEVVRLQLTELKVKRQQIQRADEILREIQAEAFAHLSNTSAIGFDQRLAAFGRDLTAFVSAKPRSVESLSARRQAILDHDLANRENRRLERVEMALRLSRWCVQREERQDVPPASLGAAASYHLHEGGFIDWARNCLRAGDAVRELSEAYARLFDEVSRTREENARHFAQILADWTTSGSSSSDVIPIERVLEQTVAAIAADRPVLVIVIDGMSVAVCNELLRDLARHEWTMLSEPGRIFNRPGLATIPSVTEFSRTSLLCGRLRQGTANDEQAGFSEHPALVAQSRSGYPPILFHKVSLQETDDAVLALDVRKEIASDRRKIVGVVVNAVDDHLLKGDQLDICWSRDEIKVLPALLHEARIARRIVVLLSDHGHVLDCHAEGRQWAVCGERWRVSTGDPAGDELLVQGQRVLVEGHKLIAPWSERVRFGIKKNGYHGGLTPQEMVVPIVVMSSTDDYPAGWQEQAVGAPDWWDAPTPKTSSEGQPPPKLKKSPAAASKGLLFDEFDDDERQPAEETAGAAHPEWVSRLITSPVFHEQKRLGGRVVPGDEVFARLLSLLDERGGKLTSTALARAMEYPVFRLPNLLAQLQRVLNIDGYPVLGRDESSDTVELNRGLLLKQFDLA
jgi:hypothetical protein